ncbi:MAG: methyltransferase domain-containing protein [Bacteroidetes bacterium]|nr:methyltransferase domain-containing protein [Bacteroidota bacterium]
MEIILLTLEIIIALILVSATLSTLFGAPYYPSNDLAVKRILKLAKLKEKDRIIEIGSGGGKIVIALAQRGYKVTGIEINPFLVIFSKIRIKRAGLSDKAEIKWGNLWQQSFKDYNILICYLFPVTMDKLYDKLKKELKPGSKIVSNSFKIKKLKIQNSEGKVYLYKIN